METPQKGLKTVTKVATTTQQGTTTTTAIRPEESKDLTIKQKIEKYNKLKKTPAGVINQQQAHNNINKPRRKTTRKQHKPTM